MFAEVNAGMNKKRPEFTFSINQKQKKIKKCKEMIDTFLSEWYYILAPRLKQFNQGCPRGFSSVGRASALQAEGQRFEPVSPHHLLN